MNKTAEEYEEIIENLMRRMKAWAYRDVLEKMIFKK